MNDFLLASSPGLWGNSIGVATALSTDGDATRMRIAVFYTPPGTATAVFVEEFDKLSFNPAEESFVNTALRRSNYIRWNPAAALQLPAALLSKQPMTPAPVRKGGVSFHHGNTFHQSGPNHSTRWRRACALHYVRNDVEFAHPALPYDNGLKLRIT